MSSNVIDDKIVRLEFDNSKFESNVKTSMTTLEKLKSALKFNGAADSMNEVNQAVKNVDFQPMSNGLTSVTEKFSVWEAIAFSAIQRVTNKVMDLGERMVSSLTIDQVTEGWSKYNTMNESVATIMAATGDSMEDVEAQLDRLMWFADETSYSFTDMTTSLGKFTSAGLGAEESVTALQGIASWAAVSGVNASRASSAYYNLSQAIGMGYLGAQDWNSLSNLNMTTREFCDTLIDTAVELGTVERVGEDAFKVLANGKEYATTDVKSSLSDRWVTTDVMMAAFEKYGEYADAVYEISDAYDTCAEAMEHLEVDGMELGEKAFKAAQEAKTLSDAIDATKDAVSSGWLETFELIFGNYEEAKELWTDVCNYMWDIFASGAEDRNDYVEKVMSSPWDTVSKAVEIAGVETEDFQKALIEQGKLVNSELETEIENAGGFVDSLEDGWLTAEMVKTVIDNYASLDDASDDMKTLSELLEDDNSELANLTRNMAQVSGRTQFVQTLYNILEAIINIKNAALDGFSSVFHGISSSGMYDILTKIRNFTDEWFEEIEKEDGTTERVIKHYDIIVKIFQAVAAVFNIVNVVVGAFVKTIIGLLGVTENLTSSNTLLLNGISDISDFVIKISSTLTNRLQPTLTNISTAIVTVGRKATKLYKQSVQRRKYLYAINTLFDQMYQTIKNLFNHKITSDTIFDTLDKELQYLKQVLKTTYLYVTKSIFGNIKSAMTDFYNECRSKYTWFAAACDNVLDWFKKLSYTIKNTDLFSSLKKLASSFTNIFDGFDLGLFDEVKADEFTSAQEASVSFIGEVDNMSDSMDTMSNKTSTAKDKIEAFKNGLIDFGDTLKEVFNDFINSDWWNDLKKEATFDNFIMLLWGTNVASALSSLTGLSKNSTKLTDAISAAMDPTSGITKTLGDTVTNSINSLGDTLTNVTKNLSAPFTKAAKAWANNQNSTVVLNLALSVLSIAAALYIISKIDTKALQRSVEVVAAVAVIILAICLILPKIQNALGTVSSIFGGLTGKSVSSTVGTKVQSVGIIFGIAAIILAISLAISKINSIKIDSTIIKRIVVFTLVVAVLVSAMKILTNAGPKLTSVLGLVLLVLSIIPMFAALVLVSKMAQRLSGTDIGYIAGIMVSIMFVLWIFGQESGNALKAAASIALITVSMILMTVLFKMVSILFGSISWTALGKSILGWIVIIAAIGVLLMALSNSSQYAIKAGVAIVLISIAIMVLVQCMTSLVMLYILNSDAAVAASATLILLVVALAAVIWAISAIKNDAIQNAIKVMLAVTIFIAAYGGMMYILSKFCDWNTIKMSVVAIIEMMVLIALVKKMSEISVDWKNMATTLVGVAVLTVAIIALSYGLKYLDDISWDTLGKAVVALVEFIVVFAALVGIMALASSLSAGILAISAAFFILALAITMVISAISNLKNANTTSVSTSAVAAYSKQTKKSTQDTVQTITNGNEEIQKSNAETAEAAISNQQSITESAAVESTASTDIWGDNFNISDYIGSDVSISEDSISAFTDSMSGYGTDASSLFGGNFDLSSIDIEGQLGNLLGSNSVQSTVSSLAEQLGATFSEEFTNAINGLQDTVEEWYDDTWLGKFTNTIGITKSKYDKDHAGEWVDNMFSGVGLNSNVKYTAETNPDATQTVDNITDARYTTVVDNATGAQIVEKGEDVFNAVTRLDNSDVENGQRLVSTLNTLTTNTNGTMNKLVSHLKANPTTTNNITNVSNDYSDHSTTNLTANANTTNTLSMNEFKTMLTNALYGAKSAVNKGPTRGY